MLLQAVKGACLETLEYLSIGSLDLSIALWMHNRCIADVDAEVFAVFLKHSAGELGPIVSHPSSEKMKPKPLYVCLGCSNHTYSNNMVNRYNISINYTVKSYKMTHGSKRKITEWRRNLSVGASSTGTTRGEAGLVFIF
jgi:hypothetical protein